MGHLFANCTSLTFVDLSSFDTSKVRFMDFMFYNCFSLTSLNLSNFDTSEVTRIYNMFQNCTLLTSLNLSNFKLPKINDISNMIIDCKNLQYLNLKNKKLNSSIVQKIIKNTAINTVICSNEEVYNNCLNSNDKNCIVLDCSENRIETCYKVEDYFLSKCKIKLQILEEKEIFKKTIINSIKNGSLTNLITSRIYNDSYLMINDENEIYLISTLEKQMFMENITSINFTECEKN